MKGKNHRRMLAFLLSLSMAVTNVSFANAQTAESNEAEVETILVK